MIHFSFPANTHQAQLFAPKLALEVSEPMAGAGSASSNLRPEAAACCTSLETIFAGSL